MRFVPTSPPTTIPPEGDQPGALRPVRPTQRVQPRMRVPLVFPRFARKVEPVTEQAESVPVDRRGSVNRRKWCRRTRHNDYLLNTRSGEDRRKKIRRRGETAATLDEEV